MKLALSILFISLTFLTYSQQDARARSKVLLAKNGNVELYSIDKENLPKGQYLLRVETKTKHWKMAVTGGSISRSAKDWMMHFSKGAKKAKISISVGGKLIFTIELEP